MNNMKSKAEEALEKAKASWEARKEEAAKWMGEQKEKDWMKGAFSNRYGAGDWKSKFGQKRFGQKTKDESSDQYDSSAEGEASGEESESNADADAEAEEA